MDDGTLVHSFKRDGHWYDVVRPCSLSYEQCISFFSRKKGAPTCLTLDGALVILDKTYGYEDEERLMNIELRDEIKVDFIYENVNFYPLSHRYDCMRLKVIDVKTGEAIDDGTSYVLRKIREIINDSKGADHGDIQH